MKSDVGRDTNKSNMETWCRWLLHDSLKNYRLVVQFPESPLNFKL